MAWWFPKSGQEADDSADARARMIEQQLRPRGISDPRVLAAMGRVERERFVPPDLAGRAYDDEALAIGQGQTISQPYMVAVMSQLLELSTGQRVLEIGTGSGYQTAILAELVQSPRTAVRELSAVPAGELAGFIDTVERLAELSESARARLERLGCANIRFHVGDGSAGWPESAPYDAILLTAGAPAVPGPLIEQLAVGGRFVGPIGPQDRQTLVRWTRSPGGEILKQSLFECRFVRLIGSAGWTEQ